MLDAAGLTHAPTRLAVATYDGDGQDWDTWVRSAPDASFCHLAAWRAVMQDALGQRPLYRLIVDVDGRWHGILPAVHVRGRIFGSYLVSMPFLNYGGPLGTHAARRLLMGRALEDATRLGVDMLELRCRGNPEPEAHARKVTVTLPLPPSSDDLFAGFPSKLRSQIRRPMKAGHEVRFGPSQREPFYEVFSHNMRDLGTPVLPRRFFEQLSEHLSDQVVFGVVHRQGRPVAGGCGFIWREEFEMTWASSLREFNREAPNMLLYWSFMERMAQAGIRRFNFGRCTPGAGTHRFKMQWGGREEPLPWLSWSPTGRESTPSPDGPFFRLATRAWSRLPLPVANTIGPMLSRWLP